MTSTDSLPTMRVFLVDDEDPSRRLLMHHLKKRPEIEIVGDSGDPLEAVEKINDLKPDLVFLDIQMPVMDGFDLIPYLKHKPLVVFCTAYDEHAVRAFEVHAVDYILKPVNSDRLDQCLVKVHDTWSKLEKVANLKGDDPGLQKIICYQSGAYEIVWTKDIAKLEKDDRYTAVQTIDGKVFLSDLSIAYLAENIKDKRFFQVNRALIVTRESLVRYEFTESGTVELELHGDESCTVSRRRVKGFKTWLQEE